MKLKVAKKIINDSKKGTSKGYRVSFEPYSGYKYRSDYFPEKDESVMTVLAESLNEGNVSMTSESQIEKQLMEIYNYFQMMGSQSGVQARIPYLFWID